MPTWTRDAYTIDTDPGRLDLDVIHGYLTRSYWSRGIPRDLVQRSIDHSIPFGLYHGERQIGFARVISDRTIFAYLADVFVLEEYRGEGLGKWLVATVREHPDLLRLRRWLLATRDAHGLYAQLGWGPPQRPERLMEIVSPDPYPEPDAPEDAGERW